MPDVTILAITDEVVESLQDPGIAGRFHDVDLIVSCGDLPYSYLEYIVSVLNKPAYYVHGNHDVDVMFTDEGPVRVRPAGADSLDLPGRRRAQGHSARRSRGIDPVRP